MIRDAASLILYRQRDQHIEALMGIRSAQHRFMPHFLVFPGGAMEEIDIAQAQHPLLPQRERGKFADPCMADALARTALRETTEETHCQFLLPGNDISNMENLQYLGEATTPEPSPIRFCARFFALPWQDDMGTPQASNELLTLRWTTLDQTPPQPVVDITAFLIREFSQILRRAAEGEWFGYESRPQGERITWQR